MSPAIRSSARPEGDSGSRLRGAHYVAFCAALLAASVLLRWALVRAGWFLDDFNQQSLVDGNMLPARGIWDMHVAIHGDDAARLIAKGALPWWSDPQLVFAPLRPLTSPLIWLEYHWMRSSPLAMHLVSFAVWLGFAALVLRLFWVTMAPRAAFCAALLFALSPVHCGALGWIASQALLVSAAFGALAMNAYVAFRRTGSRPAGAVFVAAYALALLGGEYALSIGAYFCAYEILVARGPILPRLRALAPAAIASAAYLAWHAIGGYGSRGASSYVDIVAAPAEFLGSFVESVPAYIVAGLGGYPAATAETGFAGWALAVLLLCGLALRAVGLLGPEETLRPGARAALAWLLGGLLATAPYGTVYYSPRLGVIPAIGFAAFLGTVVDAALASFATTSSGRAARPVWPLACIAYIGVTGLLVAGRESRRASAEIVARHEAHASRARRAPVGREAERPAAEHVFLMSALNVPVAQTLGLSRAAEHEPLAMWRVLSPAVGPHYLLRTGDRSFWLQTLSNGIFTNPTAAAYRRRDEGLPEGARIETDELTVTVVKRAEGGPYLLYFELKEPLESPRYRFLTPLPGGFEETHLPAVGKDAIIPAALPPAGLSVD